MARISKYAYNTFQANITIAKGFIELHSLMDDLLEHGGERTIGQLMSILDSGMKMATGQGLREFEESIERYLSMEIEKKTGIPEKE